VRVGCEGRENCVVVLEEGALWGLDIVDESGGGGKGEGRGVRE